MYKITKLEIENYRAFYGGPYTVDLPNGENLLLYGENGSGKSSLLMAVREWLESSRADWKHPDFQNQVCLFADENAVPKINISVNDFNGQATAASNTQQSYVCEGSTTRSTRNPVVSQMRERHGYLTYRTLLQTSLTRNGNIFEIVVNQILGDIKLGQGNKTIRERWKAIDALRSEDQRKVSEAKRTLIPTFNDELVSLIQKSLQPLVNGILTQFFSFTGIQISIGTPNLSLPNERYPQRMGGTSRIFRGAEIKIGVDLFGTSILKHESTLNEARLTAIAISMFLAGRLVQDRISRNNTGILILDDVFIGLDTSNRIPLLQLLTAESVKYVDSEGKRKKRTLFRGYQILIATYDRYWFNVAREWFGRNAKGTWASYEMYVYDQGISSRGVQFDQPLLKNYGDNLGSAIRYFHNSVHPDFIAAATFFRKAAEEMLTAFLPGRLIQKAKSAKNVKRDADASPELEPIMLKELCGLTESLLMQMGQPTGAIGELRHHLRTLLNPMSHYEREQSPLFREELRRIEKLLRDDLPPFLADLKSRFALAVPIGNKIRIRFYLGAKHIGWYELILSSDLYAIKNVSTGNLIFSKCGFNYCSAFDLSSSNTLASWRNTPRKNEVSRFESIENAYDVLYNHLVAKNPGLYRHVNYIDACKILIYNKNPKPLRNCLDFLA